jgi:hypothetical protein
MNESRSVLTTFFNHRTPVTVSALNQGPTRHYANTRNGSKGYTLCLLEQVIITAVIDDQISILQLDHVHIEMFPHIRNFLIQQCDQMIQFDAMVGRYQYRTGQYNWTFRFIQHLTTINPGSNNKSQRPISPTNTLEPDIKYDRGSPYPFEPIIEPSIS